MTEENFKPDLLTVDQFLKCFSIGRTTLYREAAAGRIRLRKLGTATRISRQDAEAWAASLPIVTGKAA